VATAVGGRGHRLLACTLDERRLDPAEPIPAYRLGEFDSYPALFLFGAVLTLLGALAIRPARRLK
jgi:hypothetical protein